MKALVSVVLALSLIATGCGEESGTPTSTRPGSTVERGAVFIDSVEFSYLESYPVQVRVAIIGDLPTPCHEPGWYLDDSDPAAPILEVWSEIDITLTCIQVLEPFEATISIGSFETGPYTLTINGEMYAFEV